MELSELSMNPLLNLLANMMYATLHLLPVILLYGELVSNV